MLLLRNASIATMVGDEPYGLINDGAVVVNDEWIEWCGKEKELPEKYRRYPEHDLKRRLVTPALIDCHSHVVHAGNRAAEFEQRLNGASYEQMAHAGGGILSTVRATRAASQEQLLATALPRIDALLSEGISTIEIKSGYGLDRETELKMLRVARTVANHRKIRVRTSFLGAHAVPPEFNAQPDAYIDEICIPTLLAAHAEGLVDAVDGFCEGIAFSTDQIERVFLAAQSVGLPVKLHAEQLSHRGATELATKYGALSADHIEHANDADTAAMAASGTVAVLLPGAFYTLRERQLPPIQALRSNDVPIALATDCNPGSSPLSSLLLTMNMACTLFRLSPQEALSGVTRNAAKALGLGDIGHIAPGLRADMAIWNVGHPAELSYRIGFNPLHKRIFAGQLA